MKDVRQKSGDRMDLRQVLIENRPAFLAYLRKRSGSQAEREDILHDFYVRALRQAHQIRSPESTRAWLYRLLNSAVIDHIRRASRERQRQALNAVDAIIDEDRIAHTPSRICRCLHHVLSQIKPEQASLIQTIDLHGLSRKAAANQLGLKPNAFAVRLHRARQALKDRLMRYCVTCPQTGFSDCGCPT